MSQDRILDLAEAIWADFEADTHARCGHLGALAGLGFKDWIPSIGYLAPSTPARRTKILQRLSGKPFAAELFRLGLAGHPRRHLEPKWEPFDEYVEIDGDGALHWGLCETRGRDVKFAHMFDRMELVVHDDGEPVAGPIRAEPFRAVTSLQALGLDDDDYRFELVCRRDYGSRYGWWIDMAIVDGVWQVLDFQGRDWDGEYTGRPIARQQVSAERRALNEKKRREAERREAMRQSADPLAEAVAYILSIRDDPPNQAVRGNPHHVLKWSRVLVTLGEYIPGVAPMPPSEIRASAARWPDSPWAPAAQALAAGE